METNDRHGGKVATDRRTSEEHSRHGRIRVVIEEKVQRFIADAGSGDFNELAKGAFAFQYERLDAYRQLCERAGVEPSQITDWRQIPPIPALAFKSLDLATRSGGEVFRSSGTTTERRSVHSHGFLDLYRSTIDHTFPNAVLAGTTRLPALILIPDRQQAPESSLSFMVDHIIARWGATGSLNAIGPRGVDARRARSFLSAQQRDRQPTLILSTAFALVQLLESLQRLDLRFRLPPGSVVFETGGYKGRSREVARSDLVEGLHDRLAVPPEMIVREYGMTELTSQLYSAVRLGGDSDLLVPPHWVRTRVLDPESLAEAQPGTPGLICILDLANLSSAVHLLTEDLGVARHGGLVLKGRAAGAELRGCSLTIEELTR